MDEPDKVARHFARFGVERIVTHHRLRSEEFFARYDALALPPIDVAFIDGSHAYDDVRLDFVSTLKRARANSYILLHDTNIYVRELVRHAGVKRWLRRVANERKLFEIVDFVLVWSRDRARARRRCLEMHRRSVALIVAFIVVALGAGFVFWRTVWFWRNPERLTPPGEGLVAAADGTVVYVKKVASDDDVITIKEGLPARLTDIVADDIARPKLVIGVFMSPFDVHYNRAPLSGTIEFVRHYPGRGANAHMGPMHWNVLTGRDPLYDGSVHVVQNERTVTKINGTRGGDAFPCYVVQIAAKTVSGIDSYVRPGEVVERGRIFGMIRIGSRVDLIVPWREGMTVRARSGDRVRAGETILVD